MRCRCGFAIPTEARRPDFTASRTTTIRARTPSARVPTLIKPGGNWANKPGVATLIMQDAAREVQEAEARIRADDAKARAQSAKHLPDINAAVKRAMVTPTPRP